MAYRADSSGTAQQIVVDSITSPAGDVQAFKLLDGTAGSGTPIPGDAHGLCVQQLGPATSAVSSVAGATSVQTLLVANANRRGATIVNESTAVMYLKLGATASASSYTIALGPASGAPAVGSYYEVPYGYTGIITAIWTAANGNARVTELTW